MTKLFISYRRIDGFEVKRLARALRQEFGKNHIFYDQTSIELGDAWPESIETALNEAEVIILVIGPKWLHLQDPKSGKRRIDLDGDWVRKETIRAIQRKQENPDLLVLPVLINNASLPDKDFLDEALKPLCDYQALFLEYTGSNNDYTEIIKKLVSANVFSSSPPPVVTPVMSQLPKRLTKAEEDLFLNEFDQWKLIEKDKPGSQDDVIVELYRVYEFMNYETTFEFMRKLDEYVIRPHNHHPRIQITYNRFEIWLCTFNIGHKPSHRDLRFAKDCEKIYTDFLIVQNNND